MRVMNNVKHLDVTRIIHWLKYSFIICTTVLTQIITWVWLHGSLMFVLGQSSDTDEIKTRRYAAASCPDQISVAFGRCSSRGSSSYVGYLSSADRLSDFIVTVSNVSFPVTSAQLVPPKFILCGQYQGYPGPSQTGTVICSPGPSRGRFVFISLPTLGVLTMCEARVFAGRSYAS